MRVLVTIQPGDGHLNQVQPLARALAERHEVLFAGSPAFAPAVEEAGFRQLPAGRDWLLRDLGLHYPEAAPLVGEERTAAVYKYGFLGGAARELAPDLVRLIRSEGIDLVVADAASFAGAVAAEAAGVPHVEVAVAGLSGNRTYFRRFMTLYDELRALVGLPPDPDLEAPWRHLLLSPVPRLFYGDSDLPPTFAAARMDSFAALPAPAWLAELARRPIVYVTLGTIHNRHPETFAAVAAAVADEDVSVVMTTGENVDPAGLGPLPANVHVERYVPQLALLPACAAVVCHAGSGTLRAAAWYGLPMVLIPFSADQPFNARVFAEIGSAITVPPSDATPGALRDAVRGVLDGADYRARAAAVQGEMHAMPALDAALAAIEELAAPTAPAG